MFRTILRSAAAVAALAAALIPGRAPAQTCTAAEQVICNSNFAETLILANEWNRANGGTSNFIADSFTETVFLKSLTAATLNEMAFGDSNDTRDTKNSEVWFQNMGDFLNGGTVTSWDGGTTPTTNTMTFFPEGTILVITGATVSTDWPTELPEDLSYDPPNGDFTITIRTDNTRYFNIISNTGVITNKDLIWLDRRTNTGATPPYSTTSISNAGFALVFGSPDPSSGLGTSNSDVIVGVGTPGNGKCVTLLEGIDCACLTASWDNKIFEPCTFNDCNGGLNSAYCDSLQDPLFVDLETISAVGLPGEPVVISWTTAAEVDNAGFHIYRALQGTAKQLNGGYSVGERLTSGLIAPMGSEFEGATYYFDTNDSLTSDGEFWYYLEDVDLYGTRTLHGPVPAVLDTQGVTASDVPEWWTFQ